MKDRKLPEVDRPCPKCSNGRAYGPEYRHGTDDGLGEHLRYYCTVCRYMTFTPTADQDTPERREGLTLAFAERRARPAPPRVEINHRNRDIEETRRQITQRPYGWRG